MIHCLTVLLGKKFLLIPSLTVSCFNLCLLPLIFPPCVAAKSLDPSPLPPRFSYWGAIFRSPWSCLFSRLNEPLSVNLWTSAPALTILAAFCWTCSSLFMTFLYSAGPKLDDLLQMSSNECWVDDDRHFCWSAGYNLVNTAVVCLCWQDALLVHFHLAALKASAVFLRPVPQSLSPPACDNARVSLPRGRTHHLSSLSFFSLISSHSSSLSVQTCVCRSSTPPVDFRCGERSINHNLLSLTIRPVYCLSGCSCTQS